MRQIFVLSVGVLMLAHGAVGQEPAGGQALQPDASWKTIGPGVWFDPAGKKLIVKAKVVLREGVLEHLLCLKGTKEHEAIVSTEASPRRIHAGLLLTGAEVRHPVRFLPKFEPPAGTPIRIEAHWVKDGKEQHEDIRRWVRDEKTKVPLSVDWVFAGSELFDDPVTKKRLYAADGGDLITVANFGSAILDIPVVSSANDADRFFMANTAVIPPLGTEVFLYMAPRTAKDGAGKAGVVVKPKP
jgi:hypothetical protein